MPVDPDGVSHFKRCELTTETDLAWAAGIIEGEGAIRINSITKRNQGNLVVQIASTDEAMVDWFVHRFGGTVSKIKPAPNRKPAWRWIIASRQAAAFLWVIGEYCRIPRIVEKLNLALWFQGQKSRYQKINRTENYKKWQMAFFDRMKKLNIRGYNPDA
jgi:hypothetical protein